MIIVKTNENNRNPISEINPVGAGLLKDPAAYPWSSARAHIDGGDDKPVSVSPLLEMVADWKEFIGAVSESPE